jgi:hypothetical protein
MDQNIQRVVREHPQVRANGSVETHVTVNVVVGRTYNPVRAMLVFLALISIPALPIIFCCTLVLLPYIIPIAVIGLGIWALCNRLQY